jgi:hypothetical protein
VLVGFGCEADADGPVCAGDLGGGGGGGGGGACLVEVGGAGKAEGPATAPPPRPAACISWCFFNILSNWGFISIARFLASSSLNKVIPFWVVVGRVDLSPSVDAAG